MDIFLQLPYEAKIKQKCEMFCDDHIYFLLYNSNETFSILSEFLFHYVTVIKLISTVIF